MITGVVFTSLVSLYAVIITLLYVRQRTNNIQKPASKKVDQTTIKPEPVSSEELENLESTASQAMLDKADEAQRLHQTFQKFVPRQFVDHFAKGGADLLKLGYADEDEVAVMFCDIRGFTSLSEQMNPQQLMNFLNAYFLRMNAPIHENHGFIDKFIGDAIMALFDHPNGTLSDKALDSVQAALDLQKALRLYNHHRAKSGYAAVKNGIGLHLGPVVLGTVGSDDRMDTTVIGDAVNIAQRIESLTNYFGCDILASRSIIDAASKRTVFAFRTIDHVLLKGKSSKVEIIEIYQHLSDSEINDRNASKNLLQTGIQMRDAHDFENALALFQQASKDYPRDSVFDHHVSICQKLLNTSDWDGIIRL